MVNTNFDIKDWLPFVGNKPFSKNVVLLLAYGFIVPWILHFFPFGSIPWGLPARFSSWIMQPWTSVTYFIVSTSLLSAIGAGFWVYYFGKIAEDILGSKRLSQIFWIAGIAVGIIYLATTLILPNITKGLFSVMVGVSAIVYAVGYYFPNYRVFLFGVVEIELRWLAAIKAVFDVLLVLNSFSTGIWVLLGGAIGLLLAMHIKGTTNVPFLDTLLNWNPFSTNPTPGRRPKVISINKPMPAKNNKPSQAATQTDEMINSLLDKINKHGYQSLSEEEKQTLLDKSKEV